jgi:hypothetical protein
VAGSGRDEPDGKGRPTQGPTLRWVFELFIWVRLVELEDRFLVLDLAPHHETAVCLLGWGDVTSWSERGVECGQAPSAGGFAPPY